MKSRNTTNNLGFTLIELLVVIAIIGLLATVVVLSLSSARLKARDAKRKADLLQLSKAMALYFDSNGGSYPATPSYTNTGDWLSNFKTSMQPYMTKTPIDPLKNDNTRYYGYTQLDTAAPISIECQNKYVVFGYLENTGDIDYGRKHCGYGGSEYFIVLNP